jgi:uncharacterized membrane protein
MGSNPILRVLNCITWIVLSLFRVTPLLCWFPTVRLKCWKTEDTPGVGAPRLPGLKSGLTHYALASIGGPLRE